MPALSRFFNVKGSDLPSMPIGEITAYLTALEQLLAELNKSS